MSSDASWRNLEVRVAQYFERAGYTAHTNRSEPGRSGLIHEIDVLAEKRDAAGVHRVVIECKAWRSPVEKEVIYKLAEVMRDAGLSKGIVVSTGGLRSGARVAAEEAHIDVWGPDEIRRFLGDEALVGSPLAIPDEALGVEVAVARDAAEREIRKARGGFAGVGAEEVAAVDLLWVPAFELQLAVTRIRPGLINDREEVVRRWNLFEALTGQFLGERDAPRTFTTVSTDAAVLRRQKATPQIVSELRRIVAKHRAAKSDIALKSRKTAFDAVGLPGSTREFAVEAEKEVVVPFYVGRLERKGRERLIAIHAGLGSRIEAVERALHEKIDVVTPALRSASAPNETMQQQAESAALAAAPSAGPRGPDEPSERSEPGSPVPTCRCGAEMVLRHRKADGAAFWGCPTFPRCRHTSPISAHT